MDMQLPAVYISDERGYLSPMGVSRNPRRSVDTPSHFKPASLFSPTSRESDEGSFRGSETGVKGGDVELAVRDSGGSIGKDESAKLSKRRNSKGPGDKKSPRRPSHGSGEALTIALPSKSLDFSGFRKSMLFSNPAFAEGGSHSDEKKIASRLGEPAAIGTVTIIAMQGLCFSCLHGFSVPS